MTEFESFFANYPLTVAQKARKLRELIIANLPNIIEQIDVPAKMVAYCYGQKYAELICVLIPSKKGLKLGFNRGVELKDPFNILEGNGKISRYVQIKLDDELNLKPIEGLLIEGLDLYREQLNYES